MSIFESSKQFINRLRLASHPQTDNIKEKRKDLKSMVHLVQLQLQLIPCIYLITRFTSSLKIYASISFAASSSKLRFTAPTNIQLLIFLTPWQAFMQNQHPLLMTWVMLLIYIFFQSSFWGDFQHRNLLSQERQINFGWGQEVLGECLMNRQPFFRWFNTQLIDQLYELSSLLRFVGDIDLLLSQLRLRDFNSTIAEDTIYLILDIFMFIARILGSVDFILNISDNIMKKLLSFRVNYSKIFICHPYHRQQSFIFADSKYNFRGKQSLMFFLGTYMIRIKIFSQQVGWVYVWNGA